MLMTQIISSMTLMLCMLVDSIMIGRFLGVDAMTAYGLATPLLLVFAAFGSLISSGVQVMCGKSVGAGDREAADACYTVSIVLAAGVSIAGLAVGFLFLGPITSLLGAGTPSPDNPVYGLTRDYISGFLIGAPAFICAQIMVPYIQILGNRKRLIVAVAVMTLSDIAFDLLNVFAFRGGTLGMGLASALSYYLAVAVGIGVFLRKSCMFHFRLRLFGVRTCRKLLSYGVPTVINQISTVLLIFFLNRLLLEVEGTLAVAAYSVISTIGNICYCFGAGAGAVAMMLAAVFYADKDRTSIRSLIREMTVSAFALNVSVMLIVMVFATPLITLFLGPGVPANTMAVSGLRLFALSLIPSCFNSVYKNYYQGIGRLKLTEVISFLQNFFMPMVFAFLLSRFFDLTGVWLGFVCGEAATLLVFSLWVWRNNGGFSLSADAYSMLGPDFGISPDRCFECTIQSLQDAVDASQRICTFCRDKKIDEKTAMLIGLCVEEMTVNIIQHGFTRDKRDHNVDVRVVLDEDGEIIRIRDNGILFDPTDYLELHRSDDPATHIGLRMVMGMVKEANYINSLGLNNLTLIL